MKKSVIYGLIAGVLSLGSTPALAGDDVTTVISSEPFDAVTQAAHDAIVNRGYNIDYHGFIGDMLKRTAQDVGSDTALYQDAEFFTFCSAVVSRSVMEADPADIAYCPYVVFVYERTDMAGSVTVGFRRLPQGGARDQVNLLLEEIVTEAAEGF